MDAPVNVKLVSPTINVPGWAAEARKWEALNKQAGGVTGFFPLTIKAAYVVGIIHDLCISVSHLLRHPAAREVTYVPAYGVFASGVELIGRCVRGNGGAAGSSRDLETGLKWLASSDYMAVKANHTLIQTSKQGYAISRLTVLRHFAAHGQATSKDPNLMAIDTEMLAQMPPRLADGLERYWNELRASEDFCNKLAKANVIALRDWPVLKTWSLLEGGRTITDLFSAFDWRV